MDLVVVVTVFEMGRSGIEMMGGIVTIGEGVEVGNGEGVVAAVVVGEVADLEDEAISSKATVGQNVKREMRYDFRFVYISRGSQHDTFWNWEQGLFKQTTKSTQAVVMDNNTSRGGTCNH